ncbi:MAG TPA: hypothetical protein VFX61_01905 [Micromonosporaceae bacterium]|nr:hypothetical protein [Micromonosporaceae bacterium]
MTLGSGLRVSTSVSGNFTPSQDAAGHIAGNTAITVSVTIENGMDEAFDLALVSATAAFGADGILAAQVFDFEKSVSGFEGTLAFGQKRTAKMAFSADTKDTSLITLVVELNLLEDGAALFEGSL